MLVLQHDLELCTWLLGRVLRLDLVCDLGLLGFLTLIELLLVLREGLERFKLSCWCGCRGRRFGRQYPRRLRRRLRLRRLRRATWLCGSWFAGCLEHTTGASFVVAADAKTDGAVLERQALLVALMSCDKLHQRRARRCWQEAQWGRRECVVDGTGRVKEREAVAEEDERVRARRPAVARDRGMQPRLDHAHERRRRVLLARRAVIDGSRVTVCWRWRGVRQEAAKLVTEPEHVAIQVGHPGCLRRRCRSWPIPCQEDTQSRRRAHLVGRPRRDCEALADQAA